MVLGPALKTVTLLFSLSATNRRLLFPSHERPPGLSNPAWVQLVALVVKRDWPRTFEAFSPLVKPGEPVAEEGLPVGTTFCCW